MRNSALSWIVAVVFALAVVGLIAYARGDDGDDGRSPELGVGRGAAAAVLEAPT